LRVELPDLTGRRDILRIHTRRMKEAGGMSDEALSFIENLGEDGLPARTEHFTGAELAGLVRSAASFALARTVEADGSIKDSSTAGIVAVSDLVEALSEVRPALGKQDEVLEARYPYGVSPCSKSMERIMRDLKRFTSSPTITATPEQKLKPQMSSILVVGAGGRGGTGVSALACWAAADASERGEAEYVRLLTSLDLLADGGSDEESRAAVLMTKFTEAGEMPSSLLVLDDVDQLCAGSGPGGYSSIMLATLRALLRTPPSSTNTAKAGGHSMAKKSANGKQRPKTVRVIATTSRSDAACITLHELFDETLVVSELDEAESVTRLLKDSSEQSGLAIAHPMEMANRIIIRLGRIGCKSALRLAERSVAIGGDDGNAQLVALDTILEDFTSDERVAGAMCEVL
jgi:SpoVK/Ycf46/Vps4 family AAA+-type ATPase